MKQLTTIFFLAILLPATAQYVSPLGRFTVDYNKGCSPLTITVTPTGEAASVQGIQYSYEEDEVETTETSYDYTTAGNYRIIQFLGESFSPQTDTVYLTIREPLEPVFEIYYCSETQFVLHMKDDYYDFFYAKTNSNDSVLVSPNSSTTLDFPSGNGTLTIEGYFEGSFANCGVVNRSFSLTTLEETHPDNLQLQYGCSDDYYLQLDATRLSPFQLYQLQYSVDNSGFQDAYTGQVLNGQTLYPITLPGLNNPQEVCLRFNTLNPCDSTILFSTDYCQNIESFYSLENAYATYLGEQVLINSDTINGTLNLYKTTGQNFAFATEFTSSTLDNPSSKFRPTNYKIVATDSCGIVLDSIFISPPFLELIDKSYSDNLLTIDAQEPLNNYNRIADSVLIYNLDSTIVTSTLYSPEIRIPATIGDFVRLRLKYTYDNNLNLYSNAVETEVIVKVYVPDAFTPNNDGLNDELEIFGLPTSNFTIQIFDRWGKVIHQATENPVWNGRVGKKQVITGSYLYRLTFELESGELKTQVGTFAVLKN
ncbi:T9SS type B sorting domain-containing protein [Marinoscillum pacificum]|uniref:T9SS type B sorting domain-containing protein n=1 Tax=Marinoscillum pacificum TaxID=392723 RepID=UPI0021577A9C|nr:gliding motility-associated C-terminal domain-containing protein [Marinoscillum pacificum]